MPFRLCNRNKKTNQFRTAQLHIQKTEKERGEERTPCREGMLCSLSVEAAAALPLFLSAMCLLMYPMRVIEAESTAQMKLEQAAEYISAAEGIRMTVNRNGSAENGREGTPDTGRSGYLSEKKTGEESGTEKELTPSGFMKLAESAYSVETVITGFDHKVFSQAVPTAVKLPDAENPFIKINVACTVNYPFPALLGDRLQSIRLVTYRRAWVGRKGGAGRKWMPDEKTEDAEEGKDRTVYVARNSAKSGRYHVSSGCHYISNRMSVVSRSSIDTLRNKEGGKYHPCSSCQASSCETVYVFEHGDAFHSTPDCKANRSYAVEMKESEAIGRGLSPCTYCSRK